MAPDGSLIYLDLSGSLNLSFIISSSLHARTTALPLFFPLPYISLGINTWQQLHFVFLRHSSRAVVRRATTWHGQRQHVNMYAYDDVVLLSLLFIVTWYGNMYAFLAGRNQTVFCGVLACCAAACVHAAAAVLREHACMCA